MNWSPQAARESPCGACSDSTVTTCVQQQAELQWTPSHTCTMCSFETELNMAKNWCQNIIVIGTF